MSRAFALLPARASGDSRTPVSDWPIGIFLEARFLWRAARVGFRFFRRELPLTAPWTRPSSEAHFASRDERRGAPPCRGRGARGWRARARARAPVHADGLGQGTSRALGERACRREPAHLSVRNETPFLAPHRLLLDRRRAPQRRRRSRPRAARAFESPRRTHETPTLTGTPCPESRRAAHPPRIHHHRRL